MSDPGEPTGPVRVDPAEMPPMLQAFVQLRADVHRLSERLAVVESQQASELARRRH